MSISRVISLSPSLSNKNEKVHMAIAVALRRQSRLIGTLGILFLSFLVITFQVVWDGPLRDLDASLGGTNWYERHPLALRVAGWIDHLGLRGVTAAILLALSLEIARRHRVWRPIILSVVALIALNLVVGFLKLTVGRTKPRLGLDLVDAGGMSFPSGHAANAILTWGLIAYLLIQYSRRARRVTGRLVVIVASITVAVCSVSLFRNTHWLTDLIGGVLVGACLLLVIIAWDRHALMERPSKVSA
jgi:membrane-associated phospholipid phosphatase